MEAAVHEHSSAQGCLLMANPMLVRMLIVISIKTNVLTSKPRVI